MLNRLQIKKILSNVNKVSRKTLLKKASDLGLDVKQGVSDSQLRKQIKKAGEKQIDAQMTKVIKRMNEEHKEKVIKSKYEFNSQGVKILKKDYKEILDLQNKYNEKKERILNNYIKKREKEGNPLSEIEVKFLKGESVRHLNSSENLTLNTNFRKENLIDSISEGVDIKFYKKTIEDEIKHFRINNIIQNRTRKLNKYLNEWVNSGDLTENRAKEIQDLYKNMNIINKSQFNKDLEKKMSMVESVVRNPRSGYDVYHALKEIALIQNDRDFIVN
ncbi:MAG: hypothetical protein IJ094_03590 [Bacilli bacterium]|nr:hypothetical protein [Bacilli bacterium]